MRTFDFFDHGSDIGVSVKADTLEELFILCAEALFSLIGEKKRTGKGLSFRGKLKGDTLEDLLVNWMNELIFYFESKEFYGQKFNFEFLSEIPDKNKKYALSFKADGEKIVWGEDEISREVKAATYHQLKIIEKNGKYQVKIVFDL